MTMQEADYDALRKHLIEVMPIFDMFCGSHGFNYLPKPAGLEHLKFWPSLGRYPRVRVNRYGDINLYFDLWMDEDKNGERFEQFRRDLPYSLYCGGGLDEFDGPDRVRFHIGFTCFSGKPFDQVGAVLMNEMETYLPIIESLDAQYLRDFGATGLLR